MKSSPLQPEYLDVKALATYSSLSPRTLRKIVSQPGGPTFFRLSGPGKILIKKTDFDSWMSQFKQKTDDFDTLINDTLKEFGAKQ